MLRTLVKLPLLIAFTTLCGWMSNPSHAQVKSARPGLDVMNRLQDIRQGTKPFKEPIGALDKQNKDDMNALTLWLAYRLKQPELYGEKPDGGTGLPATEDAYYKVVDDPQYGVQKYFIPAEGGKRLSDGQRDYNQAFADNMVKHLSEVMKDQKMIVRVNAARMLSLIGKSGVESLADTYLTLIDDPNESEATKLYALQGLGYLLRIPNTLQPNKPYIQKEERLVRIARTLVDLIEGKTKPAAPDAPMVKPSSPEVVRFLRREAIRALGGMYTSVIRDVNGKPVVNAGWTLMRVALRDSSLKPMPSPSEQLEALIGFCQMQPDEELNLDYSAAVINAAIVDIGRHKIGGSKALPWKLAAARLTLALNQFKTSTGKLNASREPKLVAGTVDEAILDVLAPLEKDGLNAQINPDKLASTQVAPKSASLYADQKNTILSPPQALGG